MWETWVQPLGWEDPLEKGKATHSSILAWRIPWTEEIGELQSVGPQRVRHNWVTNIHTNHRGESLTMTPWLQGWSLCAVETTCVSNPMSLGISIYLSIHTEKAMAPHSSTLTWKIPWTEKPVGLQSMGSLRVGHDWMTSLSLFTFMHWRRKWQPTPVFLPGESQGLGSPMGCRLWGRTESDTTEVT